MQRSSLLRADNVIFVCLLACWHVTWMTCSSRSKWLTTEGTWQWRHWTTSTRRQTGTSPAHRVPRATRRTDVGAERIYERRPKPIRPSRLDTVQYNNLLRFLVHHLKHV